ncbi:hypothetical protein JOQ06_011002 [Pogonophryne albipinna]|uniref:Uncharacterized protein n=1 Tax=Pogonophryne albipinna TaxID=1090488 RepID=A0AAD6AVA9_9TELE|nr:hypothetical protein JOQ06_010459 [Pogonophryne albipinna]KAJ4932584.1 hypothetical protein JOQ06_011002 [Pogonophryne albipinna]
MLPSLTKEDLLDLLPGSEHFFRRRTIWRLTHDDNEGQERDLCRPSTSHGTCDFSPIPTTQPSFRELTVMAKRLIEYYPMLRDRSQTSRAEWETVKKQLLKRIQNVTTPKKKQGSTPSRKRPRSLSFQSSHETSTDETDESTASTLILERSPTSRCSAPEAAQLCASETESPQTQARHYKTLQAMYKTKARPNKMDVAQLLDLEIQARRAFIDSDVTKEQDRPSNILKAYPCFGELDHLMDELRRILNQGNSHFLMELKTRWGTFCERAQFYGVFKKLMRPPQLDKVKHSIAMMKALPEMHASEAVLHVLESAEDPNTFLQTRPLSSPVVIICETNCILAIGTMPVLIFPKEDIHESVMYLMACYYTFHLTYPKCIATLLSVVQTEVLLDAIHDCDMTTSYKKAMADWKKFISD